MTQSRNAVSNLLARYKAVLKNCHLLNTIAAAVVAGAVVVGSAGMAMADTASAIGSSVQLPALAEITIIDGEDITRFTTNGELSSQTATNSQPISSDLDGGAFTITGDETTVTMDGQFTLHGQTTITGGGTLVVTNGNLTQTASGSDISGINAELEYSLVLGNDLTVGNVELPGICLWTGVEDATAVDNKTLTIAANKTVSFDGDGSIYNYDTGSASLTINGAGAVEITGTLTTKADVTVDVDTTIAEGGKLDVNTGTFVIDSITNNGELAVSGGTLVVKDGLDAGDGDGVGYCTFTDGNVIALGSGIDMSGMSATDVETILTNANGNFAANIVTTSIKFADGLADELASLTLSNEADTYIIGNGSDGAFTNYTGGLTVADDATLNFGVADLAALSEIYGFTDPGDDYYNNELLYFTYIGTAYNQGGTFDGAITIDAGGLIAINTGNWTFGSLDVSGELEVYFDSLTVGDLTINSTGEALVYGTLTAENITVNGGTFTVDTFDNDTAPLDASYVTPGGTVTTTTLAQDAGTIEITGGGSITTTSLNQTGGTITISDGTLTVTGEAGDFSNTAYAANTSGISVESGGTLAVNADALLTDATGAYALLTPDAIIGVASGATVDITFGDVTLSTADLGDIKNAIAGNGSFYGTLDVGDVSLDLSALDVDGDGIIDYDSSIADVTSKTLQESTVLVGSTDAGNGISGGFGSVVLDTGVTSLTVTNTLALYGSGNAVADSSGDAADITLSSGSELTLAGENQTVGAITDGGSAATINVAGSGTTTIIGGINASSSSFTASSDVFSDGGDIIVDGLAILNGATVIADCNIITTDGILFENGTAIAYYEDGATDDEKKTDGSVLVEAGVIDGSGTIKADNYVYVADAQTYSAQDIVINASLGGTALPDDGSVDAAIDFDKSIALTDSSLTLIGESINIGENAKYISINAANSTVAMTGNDITLNGQLLVRENSSVSLAADTVTFDRLINVTGGSLAINAETMTFSKNIIVNADNDATAYMSVNSDVNIADQVALSGADVDSVLAVGSANFSMDSVAIGGTTTGTIDAGGMLIADMTNISTDETLFTGSAVTFADGSALRVVGAVLSGDATDADGLVGTLFESDAIASTADFSAVSLTTDSRLIEIAAVDTAGDGSVYQIQASAADVSEIFADMDSDLARHVGQAAYKQHGNPFLTKALDPSIIADNAKAAKTIEGAAKVGQAGAVGGNLTNINIAGTNNVNTRLGGFAFNDQDTSNMLAMNGDGAIVPMTGAQEGFGVWFMPMYKHTNASGFESGDYDYGFSTDLYGATLGADYTFASSLRLGLALNVGTGESDSTGDFDNTENEFDYFGVTAYAGMNFGNIGLYADMGYTASSNDITQKNTVGTLTAETDADLFSIGVKADYKIALNDFNVTPYAGARLNYYEIDGFNTKYYGQNVVSTDSSDYTIIEFPIGLTFDTTLEANGWDITPNAALGVKFAAGDLDHEQRVSFNGLPGSATVSSEVADEVTFQGGLGLGMAKDAYSIDFGYTLDLSENMESHGFNLNLRYEF